MSLFFFGQRRQKGEILKHERMLVRVERIDPAQSSSLPAEYNERSHIRTRLKRPWQEYYVVARAGTNESKHIVLQIHKSHVTPFKDQWRLTPANSCYHTCAYGEDVTVGNSTGSGGYSR